MSDNKKKIHYYKNYSALQIAALATQFSVTFFTIIRWIDKGESRLTSFEAERAMKRVESTDQLFWENKCL